MLIDKLKVNPKNPRKIGKKEFSRLKDKIRNFPEMLEKRPIVYDENFVVLGGNMRLRALKELAKEGFEIKDSYFVSAKGWTEEQKRNFIINDNISDGEWDWDLLANEWDDLPLEEWGIDPTEWDKGEVVEDEPPEVAEGEAVSKLGEVYQLGRHRLMCGDATKKEDMEKLMDGKKAGMIFTDPPYNVNYGNTMRDAILYKSKGIRARKILNDNFKNSQDFYQFLYDSISAMRPFVSGDVYICMSSSELHTLQKAFIDCGGHWSTFIIWVKQHFTLTRSNYQRQYESILYGWFEGSSHYWSGIRNLGDVVKTEDAMEDGEGNIWLKVDNLSMDVWEFDRPAKSKEHPTMKPIKLCARAITNSSRRNEIVLDCFGGSGSTLIACEQTERTCYMMELDPKYVDVIRKRYWKFVNGNDETGWEENTPAII